MPTLSLPPAGKYSKYFKYFLLNNFTFLTMHPKNLDINADLGEGGDQDEAIMPYITSCNIACGGHAGDEESIRNTIRLAKKHQVKVGAHPSFPDRESFGRKQIDIDSTTLKADLRSQLNRFFKICREEKVSLHHIKAHGALYNFGSENAEQVALMIELYKQFKPKPIIYTLDGSLLHREAAQLFPIWREAFIDRQYQSAGKLLAREQSGALINTPKKAWQQFYRMHFEGELMDYNENIHSITAETYCIHGDHESAVDILKYLHKKLKEKGVELK